MKAAAKALNMSPADYRKQMESYLKTYKMEGQQGVTQLLALQKTDPTNAVLYQQMISLISSRNNKVKNIERPDSSPSSSTKSDSVHGNVRQIPGNRPSILRNRRAALPARTRHVVTAPLNGGEKSNVNNLRNPLVVDAKKKHPSAGRGRRRKI